MQFILVMAVLAALVISDGSPSQPVSSGGSRFLTAAAGMMIVALFAALCSRLIAVRLRRDFQERHALLRRFKRLRRVHTVLWLTVAGGIFLWLDWAQLVRFNWHTDRLFLVDELLILVPVVLPMVLSWAAFYEVDLAMRTGSAAAISLEVRPGSRRQYLTLHLRHYLGILLLPVLGLLAVQDAAELWMPAILESQYAVLVHGPSLLLLLAFFPALLRYIWRTEPLPPGGLRDRLEAAAGRAGVRAREILIWHTDGMLVNAAVAGFLPPLRYVFLTDGLLCELTDEEIEAVFSHEVGHVRHRHLLLRVLAMIAPLSLWLLVEQAAPQATERLTAWLAFGGLGLQVPAGLLMLGAMGCYGLVVFGAFSRLLEGQADLFGCRTLAASPAAGRPVETYVAALEKLAAQSGADRNAPGWQHASIARRIDLLRRAASDPDYELGFHRRIRRLGLLAAGLVASPLLYRMMLG